MRTNIKPYIVDINAYLGISEGVNVWIDNSYSVVGVVIYQDEFKAKKKYDIEEVYIEWHVDEEWINEQNYLSLLNHSADACSGFISLPVSDYQFIDESYFDSDGQLMFSELNIDLKSKKIVLI